MLSPRELQELTRRTIGHYEFNSESYQIGTVDHDVSQNYMALLDSIESEIPFKILDFGCGPGRDLRYFKSLGHIPTGVEGSETFVKVAGTTIDCDVHHMNFINLDLPQFEYDGIFNGDYHSNFSLNRNCWSSRSRTHHVSHGSSTSRIAG